MDPSLKPDPEHTGLLWGAGGALIAYLIKKFGDVGAYFIRRHDDGDTKKDDHIRHLEEELHKQRLLNTQRDAELELRIVQLESRDVVTVSILQESIALALKQVREDYTPQHNSLATDIKQTKARVEECAVSINKRIDKLYTILGGNGVLGGEG